MKITIPKNKLKNGLEITEKISSKSLTLPILKNVLVKAEKNFLNLTTTDLEVGIKWWSLIKTEKEGEITVPIALLSSFVSFLPEKPLTLEIQNHNLMIECENHKSQIKGQSAEEFPIFPEISKENSVVVKNPFFCQGLAQVIDIASPSTARPEIAGIYLSFDKDQIKMTATDSFRLAEKIFLLDRPIEAEKEYSLIIPQKTGREIINTLGNKEGGLKIFWAANQIMFEFPMTETSHPLIQLTSRLIEGEYPNYQEIIPQKYETQIILEKNEFLNQIKAASFFSGRINEIKLKIDPKKEGVEILSQNPDSGKYESFLPAKIKGKKEEVSFNHKFLIDGLLNIKSSEVSFGLSAGKEANGETGPGVLRPVGDSSYLYVVMPIKNS